MKDFFVEIVKSLKKVVIVIIKEASKTFKKNHSKIKID